MKEDGTKGGSFGYPPSFILVLHPHPSAFILTLSGDRVRLPNCKIAEMIGGLRMEGFS